MKTIEEIKGGCRIEVGDDGLEHWIWAGAVREGTPNIWAPNYTKDPSGNTMTVQAGRRAVWHVLKRSPIKSGQQVYYACNYSLCLNPACIKVGTKRQQGVMVARTGRERGKPNRILNSHRNALRQTKVTDAMIADVRSGMKVKDVCSKHGVDRTMVTKVRNGKHLAVRVRNPFGALFTGLIR